MGRACVLAFPQGIAERSKEDFSRNCKAPQASACTPAWAKQILQFSSLHISAWHWVKTATTGEKTQPWDQSWPLHRMEPEWGSSSFCWCLHQHIRSSPELWWEILNYSSQMIHSKSQSGHCFPQCMAPQKGWGGKDSGSDQLWGTKRTCTQGHVWVEPRETTTGTYVLERAQTSVNDKKELRACMYHPCFTSGARVLVLEKGKIYF